MGKVFTDWSGLKKVEPKAVEKPKVVAAADDAGLAAVKFFARTEEGGDASADDLEACREALAELAEEKIVAEERLKDSNDNLNSARRRIAELEREVESLRGDNARLRGEAKKSEVAREVRPSAPVLPVAAEMPRKGILDCPFGFSEMFAGELREMVVAILSEYRKNIENGGYQRRADVLDAILAANGPSGELERRTSALRQVLKDAGYFNDPRPLEKLGIKLIDGRKHWKLEYAGIRMTLAKTPSDHCSNANSAADIARRCF